MTSHFHWGGTDTQSQNSDMPATAVTSHQRLCVINRRRLSVVQHPATVTASGIPLAKPPVIRVEAPLLPDAEADVQAARDGGDGRRHYQLMSSDFWGKARVELVPFRIGSTQFGSCSQARWAAQVLRRHLCVINGPVSSKSRDGACTISNRAVLGASAVGNVSDCLANETAPPCKFVASGLGGAPTFSYDVAFDGGLSWFALPAMLLKTDLQLQAVTACFRGAQMRADVANPSVARAITMETSPATISLLTQPPSTLRVHQVSHMCADRRDLCLHYLSHSNRTAQAPNPTPRPPFIYVLILHPPTCLYLVTPPSCSLRPLLQHPQVFVLSVHITVSSGAPLQVRLHSRHCHQHGARGPDSHAADGYQGPCPFPHPCTLRHFAV